METNPKPIACQEWKRTNFFLLNGSITRKMIAVMNKYASRPATLSAMPEDVATTAVASAGAGATAAPVPVAPTGFPQDGQNVAPSATWVPQPGQNAIERLL
jgi:hypothetical protein